LLPPQRHLVATPRQLLLGLEQLQPGRKPLFTCSGFVVDHRFLSCCGRSWPLAFRTSHGADLSARSAAAIEQICPVGLDPADAGAARHLEALEHGAVVGATTSPVAGSILSMRASAIW